MLRDQSIITLGETASLTVDELVTDSGKERQSLTVLGGAFRFVSGTIVAATPENVTLTTSVATIGIRGTEFIGG